MIRLRDTHPDSRFEPIWENGTRRGARPHPSRGSELGWFLMTLGPRTSCHELVPILERLRSSLPRPGHGDRRSHRYDDILAAAPQLDGRVRRLRKARADVSRVLHALLERAQTHPTRSIQELGLEPRLRWLHQHLRDLRDEEHELTLEAAYRDFGGGG